MRTDLLAGVAQATPAPNPPYLTGGYKSTGNSLREKVSQSFRHRSGGKKIKSVISGEMRLGNDTIPEALPTIPTRNRGAASGKPIGDKRRILLPLAYILYHAPPILSSIIGYTMTKVKCYAKYYMGCSPPSCRREVNFYILSSSSLYPFTKS